MKCHQPFDLRISSAEWNVIALSFGCQIKNIGENTADNIMMFNTFATNC